MSAPAGAAHLLDHDAAEENRSGAGYPSPDLESRLSSTENSRGSRALSGVKCAREPLILPAIAFAGGIWFAAGPPWAVIGALLLSIGARARSVHQICALAGCFL